VPAPPAPRHLLVVDDEPHIGLLLRPHLEDLGYRVSLARTLGTARTALAASRERVDALLLDLHLPDGSGLDLLRELRGAPATRGLPVMVVTAVGDDRVLDDARRLDAALVTKPFSPTKLTARIAAMLAAAPRAAPSAEAR
jgi:two-component system, OmpR family, catabolic regulation response regulator CreB